MGLQWCAAYGKRKLFWSALALIFGSCFGHASAQASFQSFVDAFVADYQKLDLPPFTYDYRDYFNSIPGVETLNAQEDFFRYVESGLRAFNQTSLQAGDRTTFNHIAYETSFNLERIALEKAWINAGRNVPTGGLSQLQNGKAWYSWFVKRYTGTAITPQEVYELGLSEVKHVKNQIESIQSKLGFKDSAAFYKHLGDDTFYITYKQQLVNGFARIDSIVRTRLNRFVGDVDVPPVYAMEWPEAGPNTPPGIYLNRQNNAYGKDVFQFNFYNRRYSRRSMEWLYLHEAIPGHHLQSSLRNVAPLQELFLYPGNFEGWACYVECFGDELGLYTDPYAELGKWEWHLVRSARLVIDAGIHYYGWSREQALDYWRKTITGQDDIAEREVTRVTNWSAQALSYKVGADFIFAMRKRWTSLHPHQPVSEFHKAYLNAGNMPLTVLEQKIMASDVE